MIPVFASPPLITSGFFQMETEATPEGVAIESFQVSTYAQYLKHPIQTNGKDITTS
jgi:hypothetical protein